MKKTVLISGAISDIPKEEAREAFAYGKKLAQERGWEAITPFDITGGYEDGSWGFYIDLTRAFIKSERCDAIALIDGWVHSDGANCEKILAHMYDKEVYLIENIPSLHRDNQDEE